MPKLGTRQAPATKPMTPNPTKRVIVVVEGGLADWVVKPDGVEVEIYDFDELGWLTRDDRYELMAQLESGDDGLATLALHLTQDHQWGDCQTEVSALPNLHAELHEQTACNHEHDEGSDQAPQPAH